MDEPEEWINRLALKLARSHFTRRSAERRAVTRIDSSGSSNSRTEHDSGIAVLGAVSALPSREKAAVILRYYEDMRTTDIARVLDCSHGTARSLVQRGSKRLAKKFELTRETGVVAHGL